MSDVTDFCDQTTTSRDFLHASRATASQSHPLVAEGSTNFLNTLVNVEGLRPLSDSTEVVRYVLTALSFAERESFISDRTPRTSHVVPSALGGARASSAFVPLAFNSRLFTDYIDLVSKFESSFGARADVGRDTRALPSEFEKALKDLERLKAGWAGPASKVPTETAISDIIAIGAYLPAEIAAPEVDVDPMNGDVTLRWTRTVSRSSFALHFRGDGDVMGALSKLPVSQYKPWRLRVTDEAGLAKRLEDEEVREHFVAE